MQSNSSTIIKNFFISGLKQETLRSVVDKPLKDQVAVPPEVLFSMYSQDSEMEPYLKFVYPDKISIERQEQSSIPKFFTFMSTDGDGVNAYFHCLIFFEQFSLYEIKNDFDHVTAKHTAERRRRLRNRNASRVSLSHNTPAWKTPPSLSTDDNLDTSDMQGGMDDSP